MPQLTLASWPPPQQSSGRLVGIARLAAEGPSLGAKTQVEYRSLPVRSILNRCDSSRVPFDYTINPYRGCEFGCKYCYARYTHEYMELDGGLFENRIYAKQRAAELLRAELKKAEGAEIAIGAATDPYQPAERYQQRLQKLVSRLREQYGLLPSPRAYPVEAPQYPVQAALFDP